MTSLQVGSPEISTSTMSSAPKASTSKKAVAITSEESDGEAEYGTYPMPGSSFMSKKDELRDVLRTRLMESGWRDTVTTMCRELIDARGLESLSLEDMIAEVRQKARDSVPEQVKVDMIELIKKSKKEFSE